MRSGLHGLVRHSQSDRTFYQYCAIKLLRKLEKVTSKEYMVNLSRKSNANDCS